MSKECKFLVLLITRIISFTGFTIFYLGAGIIFCFLLMALPFIDVITLTEPANVALKQLIYGIPFGFTWFFTKAYLNGQGYM